MTTTPTDDELDVAMRHIVTRLTSTPELVDTFPGGVWDDGPPGDLARPYVSVGVQAATDTQVTDGRTILVVVTARVVVVTDEPTYPVAAARAAHLALHRSSAGRVQACRRSQVLRYSEREDDRRWRYSGGLYVLTIGAAPGD